MISILFFAFIAFLIFMFIYARNNNHSLLLKGNQPEGLKRTYYTNGKVKFEVNFKNKKIDGCMKGYYKDGALQLESNYVDGKKEGFTKTYYKSGNMQSEANYVNGEMEYYKGYYENGKRSMEVNFENGHVIDGYKYHTDENITKMTTDELDNFVKETKSPTGLIC